MNSDNMNIHDTYVYLDININNSIESYIRAEEFVDANNIKYNFSSKVKNLVQIYIYQCYCVF